MMKKQLDARKAGWPDGFVTLFKDFSHFEKWFDPKYKNLKAEEVWKKLGGKIETKKAANE